MLIGDSAYPLAAYPTEWNGEPIVGWAFYIGGNTPHVWSDPEVAALPYRYRLPIFTCSHPTTAAAGAADGATAAAWMRAHQQPTGTLVMLDYETAEDAAYEQAFDASVRAAGYRMDLYGSKTTVVHNPAPSGGYDEAAWTGSDYAPSSTADQFADLGSYDLNDFAADAPLWDTLSEQEDMMQFIAQVQSGGDWVWIDGRYAWVATPADLAAFQALGFKTVSVSQGQHQSLLSSVAAQPVSVSVNAAQLASQVAAAVPTAAQNAAATLAAEGAADVAAAKPAA